MTADIPKTEPKRVLFKAFAHLSQLEDALKHLNNEDLVKFEISILGKFDSFYLDRNIEISDHNDAIKKYWKKTYATMAYGSLYNPQFGNLFIVGNLASTFLYKIDGKTLGMLTEGPNGIFRGVGASLKQISTHLKMLNLGSYLLIFRGIEIDLEDYKRLLGNGDS